MVSSRALEALNEEGIYRSIHGIIVDGTEPVHAFLAGLPEPDFSEFLARFDKLQESGLLSARPWRQMGNWWKGLRHVSGIWQVSATSHRLLGFRSGDSLILTSGFYKAGGETPRREVQKAEGLRERFERRS